MVPTLRRQRVDATSGGRGILILLFLLAEALNTAMWMIDQPFEQPVLLTAQGPDALADEFFADLAVAVCSQPEVEARFDATPLSGFFPEP